MFQYLTSAFSSDYAIDLGTSNTHVYVKGHGIVCSQASFVAVHENGYKAGQLAAVGNKAKELRGKTSANITCISPLVGGAIQDFKLARLMLKEFLDTIPQRNQLIKGKVLIGHPPGASEVEVRALVEAAEFAGARKVYLVNELVAAAIGAGLEIEKARGSLILDLGAGSSNLAVISLDGVVYSQSVSTGGNRLDAKIVDYIKRKHNLLIGDQTAERLKMLIGAARLSPDNPTMMVYGHDFGGGRPGSASISQADVLNAMADSLREIVKIVWLALDNTPPEVSGDLMDSGLVLVGGGSLLKDIDQLIQSETNLPVSLVQDPFTVVASGCGKILENWEKYKHLLRGF